jgi:hypothetical protein
MSGREVLVVSYRKDSGFYRFLNNFVEKERGESATSRNWSTTTRISSLCEWKQMKEHSASRGPNVIGNSSCRDGGAHL